jgi:hypothetical protein
MAAHISDFSKTPFQILLDLINEQHGTNLPETAVTFAAPVADAATDDAPAHRLGAKVTASATTGSGYKGSKEFNYHRVGLTFMEANEPDLVVETHEASVHALLPFLNTTFGINLTTDDIEDTPIPVQEPDVMTQIELVAKADSLVFAGKQALTFTLPLVELGSVLTMSVLDGLYPPAAVVEE